MSKKKVGVHGTDAETGREGTGNGNKTVCPVTREQFKKAPVLTVEFKIDGQTVATQIAAPRQFSTGSVGWYAGDKVTIPVDGVACRATVGLNVTVIGSKELPQ